MPQDRRQCARQLAAIEAVEPVAGKTLQGAGKGWLAQQVAFAQRSPTWLEHRPIGPGLIAQFGGLIACDRAATPCHFNPGAGMGNGSLEQARERQRVVERL
jgi:hypothetical protein